MDKADGLDLAVVVEVARRVLSSDVSADTPLYGFSAQDLVKLTVECEEVLKIDPPPTWSLGPTLRDWLKAAATSATRSASGEPPIVRPQLPQIRQRYIRAAVARALASGLGKPLAQAAGR
jgi:hypothetical protein